MGAVKVIFPLGVVQLVLFTMVEVGVVHCAWTAGPATNSSIVSNSPENIAHNGLVIKFWFENFKGYVG